MSKAKTEPAIRDRIKELRRVKASDLLAHPGNWRKHPQAQSAALSAVLREVGYADALLARETPEGLRLIDGHLRQKLTPDQDVPVLILDVTEEEANKILLTLDPLAAMAEGDKEALDKLLHEVSTGDVALQEMLAELSGVDADPLIEGWGETAENKAGEPKSVVAYLGLFVQDVAEFERLLALVAQPGERQIDTILRGLDAINTQRPERAGKVPQQAFAVQS